MGKIRFNPEWTLGNLMTAMLLLGGMATAYFANRAEMHERVMIIEEHQNQFEKQLKALQESQAKMIEIQANMIRVQDRLTLIVEGKIKQQP